MSAISDPRRIVTKAGLKTRPEAAIAAADSLIFTHPVAKRQYSKCPPRAPLPQNDWCVCIAVIVAKDRLSMVFNV
jgi:hypothetical protein